MKKSMRCTFFVVILAMLLGIVALTASADNPRPPADSNPSYPMGGGTVVNGDITVNDIRIPAPPAQLSAEGNVMLPLRATAEALGFEVVWIGATQSVIVVGQVQIWIGETRHISGDNFLGDFGPPPTLINSVTYVPITFFSHVLNGFSATVTNGVVIIDSLP